VPLDGAAVQVALRLKQTSDVTPETKEEQGGEQDDYRDSGFRDRF
jgi:hypothetical protein